MKPVTIALVGAGGRGLRCYAPYVSKHPERATIVAVAEPRDEYKNEAIREFNIAPSRAFSCWQDLARQPRLADAVIIATPDREHYHAAIAFAKLGYHILLEKPMAPTERECREIVSAVKEHGNILAVCHVLRYAPYFRKLREIINSGVLGTLAHINHTEHVGFWHFAHSYVRGNWRNEALSAPSLLAKSCHDLDILLFLAQRRCVSVFSSGNLLEFKSDMKPVGASERCTDCRYAERGCAYSASKFYQSRLDRGLTGWPLDVITTDVSKSGIGHALKNGPYGRCVYSCDNDVVDHQLVAMSFEGGLTANFTMNAFSTDEYRQTEIFGTRGEARGNNHQIVVRVFETGDVTSYDIAPQSGAHFGGDDALMRDFVDAVESQNPELIASGPKISLEGHLIVFAAERSRKTGEAQSICL